MLQGQLKQQMLDSLLQGQPGTQAPQIDLGNFVPSPQHAAPEAAPSGGAGSALGGMAGGMEAGSLMKNMAPGGASTGFGSAPAGVEGPSMENGGFFSSPVGAAGSGLKGLMTKLGGMFNFGG